MLKQKLFYDSCKTFSYKLLKLFFQVQIN